MSAIRSLLRHWKIALGPLQGIRWEIVVLRRQSADLGEGVRRQFWRDKSQQPLDCGGEIGPSKAMP
jgi:hypothetical protein